jgi:hypothetical protein
VKMLATHLKLLFFIVLLAASSSAAAVPFASYETRSMAMGGVGVALGEADAAPLYNPALLSVAKDDAHFSVILPSVSVRVADPDKLIDSVDKFQSGNYVDNLQSSINNLNAAINTVNTTPTPANFSDVGAKAGTVSTDLNALNTQLTTLNNKPITTEASAATVLAIPSKNTGFAFYANGSATIGGLFMYKDATLITGLATQTQCLATAAAMPTSTPAEIAAADAALQACGTPSFSNNSLQSGGNFRGVVLSEIGISLSHEFFFNHRSFAIGITPKVVRAQLYDAPISVNSNNQSSAFTGADYRADYTFVNFDVGIARYLRRGWRAGLVVKNIIPHFLDFKNAITPGTTPVPDGNTLSLRPQARAGISHSTDWSTLALDVDITRNDHAGLESATQYVALGGELNAWRAAQLRAGFRVDLVNSTRNVASLGVGLSPFGLHTDIAVAANATELGASLQIGFRY